MYSREEKILTGDKSYAYQSGQIRGLESYLLTKGDYLKLLEMEFEETAQYLEEFGYDIENISEFNKILNANINETLSLADDLIKEEQFKEIFAVRYDFLNLGLCIKNHIGDHECEYYLPGGNKNPLDFKRALEASELNRLDDLFQEAAETALLRYEGSNDPSIVDNTIEFVYMQYVQENIATNYLVEEYWKMRFDFLNLETFMRVKLFNDGNEKFWELFLEGGYLNRRWFKELMQDDLEAIPQAIKPTMYGKSLGESVNTIIEEKRFQPFLNRKDGVLIDELKKAKHSPFGLEVVFAYIMIKLGEISNIRMILKCKKAYLKKDQIKKYLPYGTV